MFPSDMIFQYFLFDTYSGRLLQVLPITLIVGIIIAGVVCSIIIEIAQPFSAEHLTSMISYRIPWVF